MASVPRQLGSQTRAILELAEYGLGGCLLPGRRRILIFDEDDEATTAVAVFSFKYEGGPEGNKARKAECFSSIPHLEVSNPNNSLKRN